MVWRGGLGVATITNNTKKRRFGWMKVGGEIHVLLIYPTGPIPGGIKILRDR